MGARVKEIFTQLVAKGMAPNAAAAEAIKQATVEYNKPPMPKLEEGMLVGESETCVVDGALCETIEKIAENMCQRNNGDKAKVGNVLAIAKKYIANVRKDPSNPRFRNFRLGNKVFDQITSTPG